MFIADADFIGTFKTGDNIGHNFHILAFLYRHYEAGSVYEKRILCKPIIITITAIIEAMLFDFHRRVKFNYVEGVGSLAENVADYIRGSKIDKLEKYIATAKNHDLFDIRDIIFLRQA